MRDHSSTRKEGLKAGGLEEKSGPKEPKLLSVPDNSRPHGGGGEGERRTAGVVCLPACNVGLLVSRVRWEGLTQRQWHTRHVGLEPSLRGETDPSPASPPLPPEEATSPLYRVRVDGGHLRTRPTSSYGDLKGSFKRFGFIRVARKS